MKKLFLFLDYSQIDKFFDNFVIYTMRNSDFQKKITNMNSNIKIKKLIN